MYKHQPDFRAAVSNSQQAIYVQGTSAGSRWQEASLEKGKLNTQITNWSTKILHAVSKLIIKGNCEMFRRILVIPEECFSTQDERKNLELISKMEKDTLRN